MRNLTVHLVELFSGFKRAQAGASAVEFALVLPAVLILIFGSIASGVMMYTIVDLQRATEASARCLSAQRADCSMADITTYASARYTGPDLDDLTFTPDNSDPDCEGYRVTATGTFSFFAGFGMLTVPMGTSSCYPSPVDSS